VFLPIADDAYVVEGVRPPTLLSLRQAPEPILVYRCSTHGFRWLKIVSQRRVEDVRAMLQYEAEDLQNRGAATVEFYSDAR